VPEASDDDLKPYRDVKSGIDKNGKIEAATVLSLTSVPDTGHHDCDGKTYDICKRYTFTLHN
jgi:hypothetical protein